MQTPRLEEEEKLTCFSILCNVHDTASGFFYHWGQRAWSPGSWLHRATHGENTKPSRPWSMFAARSYWKAPCFVFCKRLRNQRTRGRPNYMSKSKTESVKAKAKCDCCRSRTKKKNKQAPSPRNSQQQAARLIY